MKQEEIREGIADRCGNLWTLQTYEDKLKFASEILEYLHSQGVVIKSSDQCINLGGDDREFVAVEPLIEMP